MPLTITSTAFTDGGEIPSRYTCQGDDTSPPLDWRGVPETARSLVLIVDDPKNDWNRTGYGGPCPPIGRHRYFHKLYALDTVLALSGKPDARTLETAMQEHIIDQAELIGTYQKSR
jgi:phosphatidylethanolamine-binding protein (PEBP) family uncharacterized protein